MTSTSNQVIRAGIAVCVLAGASFAAYQVGYEKGAGIQGGFQTRNGQPAATGIHMVFGMVDSVSGKEITLKDVKRIPDTASGTISQPVVVTVDFSTIIERLVAKDSAVLQKEQDVFMKKVQAQGPGDSLVPPEPFVRTKITLDAIKAGDFIVASSNQDISKLTAFTATRIDVQDKSLASLTTSSAPSAASTTTIKVNEKDIPPPPLPEGITKP